MRNLMRMMLVFMAISVLPSSIFAGGGGLSIRWYDMVEFSKLHAKWKNSGKTHDYKWKNAGKRHKYRDTGTFLVEKVGQGSNCKRLEGIRHYSITLFDRGMEYVHVALYITVQCSTFTETSLVLYKRYHNIKYPLWNIHSSGSDLFRIHMIIKYMHGFLSYYNSNVKFSYLQQNLMRSFFLSLIPRVSKFIQKNKFDRVIISELYKYQNSSRLSFKDVKDFRKSYYNYFSTLANSYGHLKLYGQSSIVSEMINNHNRQDSIGSQYFKIFLFMMSHINAIRIDSLGHMIFVNSSEVQHSLSNGSNSKFLNTFVYKLFGKNIPKVTKPKLNLGLLIRSLHRKGIYKNPNKVGYREIVSVPKGTICRGIPNPIMQISTNDRHTYVLTVLVNCNSKYILSDITFQVSNRTNLRRSYSLYFLWLYKRWLIGKYFRQIAKKDVIKAYKHDIAYLFTLLLKNFQLSRKEGTWTKFPDHLSTDISKVSKSQLVSLRLKGMKLFYRLEETKNYEFLQTDYMLELQTLFMKKMVLYRVFIISLSIKLGLIIQKDGKIIRIVKKPNLLKQVSTFLEKEKFYTNFLGKFVDVNYKKLVKIGYYERATIWYASKGYSHTLKGLKDNLFSFKGVVFFCMFIGFLFFRNKKKKKKSKKKAVVKPVEKKSYDPLTFEAFIKLVDELSEILLNDLDGNEIPLSLRQKEVWQKSLYIKNTFSSFKVFEGQVSREDFYLNEYDLFDMDSKGFIVWLFEKCSQLDTYVNDKIREKANEKSKSISLVIKTEKDDSHRSQKSSRIKDAEQKEFNELKQRLKDSIADKFYAKQIMDCVKLMETSYRRPIKLIPQIEFLQKVVNGLQTLKSCNTLLVQITEPYNLLKQKKNTKNFEKAIKVLESELINQSLIND